MQTTTIYSKSVQNEINNMNEQTTITIVKVKKSNIELICAALTIVIVLAVVYTLKCLGLITEF